MCADWIIGCVIGYTISLIFCEIVKSIYLKWKSKKEFKCKALSDAITVTIDWKDDADYDLNARHIVSEYISEYCKLYFRMAYRQKEGSSTAFDEFKKCMSNYNSHEFEQIKKITVSYPSYEARKNVYYSPSTFSLYPDELSKER